MSLLKKIAFSIIPVALFGYVFLNFFFYWEVSIQVYNTIWLLATTLVLFYYILMYRLIWSMEKPKSEKRMHLILVIVFAPYGLYYIWFICGK
jgi:hypothetical protein